MVQAYKVIDDATATTEAGAVNIQDADQVVVVVKRADHSSGSSAFTATVSHDESNYIAYDRFIDNVANTNAEEGNTHITTKTLSGDGVDFIAMDPADCGIWKDIVVTVTETTDGTHSAWVVARWNND